MKKITILLCFLMLSACITTRMSGIVDPNYKGVFKIQKIIVMGAGMSIDEQKSLEYTFREALMKYNVEVLIGLDVFPPTRNYSDKKLNKIARIKGVDTILIVKAKDRGVSEKYIPQKHYSGGSTSYVTNISPEYSVTETYEKPGRTTGGYTVSKSNMSVSVNLKSTIDEKTIWTADGFSKGAGSYYKSFSKLTASIAKKTVRELSKEGFITER